MHHMHISPRTLPWLILWVTLDDITLCNFPLCSSLLHYRGLLQYRMNPISTFLESSHLTGSLSFYRLLFKIGITQILVTITMPPVHRLSPPLSLPHRPQTHSSPNYIRLGMTSFQRLCVFSFPMYASPSNIYPIYASG